MHTIENKKGTIFHNGQEKPADFFELLSNCISSIDPQKGVDFIENRRRLKLQDKLEDQQKSGTNQIVLEDHEYNHVKTLLKDMKWSVVARFIEEFHVAFFPESK